MTETQFTLTQIALFITVIPWGVLIRAVLLRLDFVDFFNPLPLWCGCGVQLMGLIWLVNII